MARHWGEALSEVLSASFLAGRCGEQDIVRWVTLSLSRQPPVSWGRRGSTERDASAAVKEKHMGTSDLPTGLWGSCLRGQQGCLTGHHGRAHWLLRAAPTPGTPGSIAEPPASCCRMWKEGFPVNPSEKALAPFTLHSPGIPGT